MTDNHDVDLDLLVTNSSIIQSQLRWAGFRRLTLRTHVAEDRAEALAHLNKTKVAAAILEYDPNNLDAFDLCKAMRDDTALKKIPVFVICKMSINQSLLAKMIESGCTEVLTAPLSQGQLHGLLCKYLAISRRRIPRVSVHTEVIVEGDPPSAGTIHDLSPYGARIQLQDRFVAEPGQLLRCRFGAGSGLQVDASVVWVRPKKGKTQVAVQFEDTPSKVVAHLENLTTWRLEEDDERQIVVLLHSLTERSNFSGLHPLLEMPVVFDLKRVSMINSIGVSRWIDLLRQLEGVVEYRLAHCSVTFCIQASYIADMTGNGEVVSLFVPYECPSCSREVERELQVKEIALSPRPVVPVFKCPSCKSDLIFADVPGRYFEFLTRAT